MNLTVQAAFSSSFYLRSFYASNQSAAQEGSYRSKTSTYLLLSADTKAIHNAVKKLSAMDFEEEENKGDINNSISAFVSTYNNLMGSSGSSDSNSVRIARNRIKGIAKNYESELKEVGLTLDNKGSIKVDRDTLSEASLKKLKSLFCDSDGFADSIKKQAKSIENYVRKHPPVTSAIPNNSNTSSQIDLFL